MAKADKKKDKGKKGNKKKDKEKKAKKAKKGDEGLKSESSKRVKSAGPALLTKKAAKLADMKCVPCRGGVPPLGEKEIKALLPKLREWKVVDGHHLEKQVTFPDFASALDFAIEVGELAEVEQHHPDILLAWGSVGIKIWTHKIDGLTESDFILAAKIDQLI